MLELKALSTWILIESDDFDTGEIDNWIIQATFFAHYRSYTTLYQNGMNSWMTFEKDNSENTRS